MRITFSGTPEQIGKAVRTVAQATTAPERTERTESDKAFIIACKIVNEDRRETAIKLYRKYFGCSLIDAKNATMLWLR